MKILIVNRFFGGAQIPTGRMVENVARVLVAEGHEVTALASSGAYEGAAQAGDTGEAGVAVGQCCGEAVNTEQPSDRKTEPPGPSGTLRVETVPIPKWMPRAVAWVWFTWQARKRIPRMDWDVCVLMTDPPLLPLLARRAAGMRHAADGIRENNHEDAQKDLAGQLKHRAESANRNEVEIAHRQTAHRQTPPNHATRRVAVWLMDLYPEALAASGRIAKCNPLYKWYFSKRQNSLAAADLLICLGQAQKELLDAGGTRLTATGAKRRWVARQPNSIQPTRIAVVPPWDDRGNIALATDASLKNLALYAGNLGEAHCFEEILAAAPYLPPDWTIRFAVRGAKRSALLSKLRSDEWRVTGDESGSASAFAPANDSGVTSGSLKITDLKLKTAGAVVHVSGYASEEETPGLLASARVHLITMSPGWEGIVVPSKLYGCIRTGRPVLFIGPENADTAREIRAHEWGKVLPPGASGEKVAGAILELAARPTKAVRPQQGAAEVAKLIQTLATD
jgi:hypothetical protein